MFVIKPKEEGCRLLRITHRSALVGTTHHFLRRAMGKLYDAWMGAWKEKNVEKILALVTDDFIFEWHSSGKLMDKAAFKGM